jgi:hypothetical protein
MEFFLFLFFFLSISLKAATKSKKISILGTSQLRQRSRHTQIAFGNSFYLTETTESEHSARGRAS